MAGSIRRRFTGRGPSNQPPAERELRQRVRELEIGGVNALSLLDEAVINTALLPDDGPRVDVDLEDGRPPRTVGLVGVVAALLSRVDLTALPVSPDAPRSEGPLLLGPHIPETDA